MSIKILNNGSWDWNGTEETSAQHFQNLDTGFVDHLLDFLKDKQVGAIMDFGCATGYFLQYLSTKTTGIELIGLEAQASKKADLHFPNIIDQDLAVPFDLGKRGVVMCIEVLEHIPQEFESVVLDNIVRHSNGYAFISWAHRGQGGHGHCNERNVDEVIQLFAARGFFALTAETNAARSAAHISWLRNNFLIFKKVQ